MAKLTEEAKTAIAEGGTGLIATAGKSGKPNVSAKGTTRVLDDETIVFADIASPRTVANIRENPQVAVYFHNPQTSRGCRVWGTGTVHSSGPVFDAVAEPLVAANMKANNVVTVAVEEVEVFSM